MVEFTDTQIDAATERGKIAHLNEPRQQRLDTTKNSVAWSLS